MQDLHDQYAELMSKLETLKLANRRFGRKEEKDEANEAKLLSSMERIGNSVFDEEFLERCRSCMARQLTSRREGASRETRIKELSEIVKCLRKCLKEYISRTKVFAQACTEESSKVEDKNRALLRRNVALQARLREAEEENKAVKGEMEKAREQSRLDRDMLSVTIRDRKEDKRTASLAMSKLKKENRVHLEKLQKMESSLRSLEEELESTRRIKDERINVLERDLDDLSDEKLQLTEEKSNLETKLRETEFSELSARIQLQNQTRKVETLKEAQEEEQQKNERSINILSNELIDLRKQISDEDQSVMLRLSALENLCFKSEENRRSLLSSLVETRGRFRVVCRLRPSTEKRYLRGEEGKRVVMEANGKQRVFTFDAVGDSTSSCCPADCFRDDVEYLVQSALDGYPVCIVTVMDHHPESGLEVETMIGGIAAQVFGFVKECRLLGWSTDIEVSLTSVDGDRGIDHLADAHIPCPTSPSRTKRIPDTEGELKKKLATCEDDFVKLFQERDAALSSTLLTVYFKRTHRTLGKQIDSTLHFAIVSTPILSGRKSSRNSQSWKIFLSTIEDTCALLSNQKPHQETPLSKILRSQLADGSKSAMILNINPDSTSLREAYEMLKAATHSHKNTENLPESSHKQIFLRRGSPERMLRKRKTTKSASNQSPSFKHSRPNPANYS